MPRFGDEFCGRLDPDGRYAIWRERKVSGYRLKRKGDDLYAQRSEEMRVMQSEVSLGLVYNPESGVPRSMSALLSFHASRVAEGSVSDLGSSKLINSEKFRTKRGERGITAYGKRLVRNGVLLLEKTYGKDCLSFFTGTFPTMSEDDAASVVLNWSKGLNLFIKNLHYALAKKGLPTMSVGCVEIQSRRAQRTGEHGLHLHLVFVGRKKNKTWALTPKQLEKIWKRTWEKNLQQKYVWSAAVNVQRIVKSASSYLAKYLSKGLPSKSQKSPSTEKQAGYPSAWYACSMSLRKWIKENTWRGNDCARFLMAAIELKDERVIYKNVIPRILNSGNVVIVCGYGSTSFTNFSSLGTG